MPSSTTSPTRRTLNFWPDSGLANRWWWSTSDLRRSIKLRVLAAQSRFPRLRWTC